MGDSREVIVVGCGMAGLTAGLAAAEAGGDVLVLESEPSVGGSMALSGGLIWSPATYELARQWVPRGDPGLQRILVDELEPAWSWLENHGLPLDPPVATHLSELPYLFDLPAATLPRPLTPEQEALAASMRRAWARFAASGDPSTAAVRWPSFGDARVMSLVPPRPRVETDFAAKHHCSFWAAG